MQAGKVMAPPGARARLLAEPDTRLAKRASEGESAAFTAIFDRYHQEIYSFAV